MTKNNKKTHNMQKNYKDTKKYIYILYIYKNMGEKFEKENKLNIMN